MKHRAILFALLLAAVPVLTTSCASREGGGSEGGISAAQTGSFDRESVYEMQDRTFRQLAY